MLERKRRAIAYILIDSDMDEIIPMYNRMEGETKIVALTNDTFNELSNMGKLDTYFDASMPYARKTSDGLFISQEEHQVAEFLYHDAIARLIDWIVENEPQKVAKPMINYFVGYLTDRDSSISFNECKEWFLKHINETTLVTDDWDTLLELYKAVTEIMERRKAI